MKRILGLLLFLFCLRVLSQLVVYLFDVPFLPAFEHWHSASIPYGVLVFSQLIIILIFSRIALQFTRGRVVALTEAGKLTSVWYQLMTDFSCRPSVVPSTNTKAKSGGGALSHRDELAYPGWYLFFYYVGSPHHRTCSTQ